MIGGVERVLDAHCRLLARAGYPVKVIAGRGDAEVIPELDSRHPEVEALTGLLAKGEEVPEDALHDLATRIGDALDRALAGVDFVVAHNLVTMHFNLPATIALQQRPVVAWVHDLTWSNPRYRHWRREGFPYDLLHRAVPSHRYVAISEQRRAEVGAVLGVPSAPVVPNGVDPAEVLQVRRSTLDLLRSVGAWPAPALVLIPFRLTRRKRIEVALEVAARVRDSRPHLRWVVSGPLGPHAGDNRDYLSMLRDQRAKQGLEEQFILLADQGDPHPVDDQMVGELYRLASVCFMPSESEGFGLPILEAGLNRVPVLCTDLDILGEVGGDGIETFPLDAPPEMIAARLEALLESRPARLQRRVQERFTWESVLPQLESAIIGDHA